jgi:hypothetical protein
MAAKNKVEEVKSLSSDLLRGFEDDLSFRGQPDTQTKNDDKLQITAKEDTSTKSIPAASPSQKRGRPTDDHKIQKKPFNIYLSEDDIKYLQDLGLVLGLEPTKIIRAWVANHRKSKEIQVQESLKQMENRHRLL